MNLVSWISSFTLLHYAVVVVVVVHGQRSVQVDLRADSWERHALAPLAEIAEFVAESSSSSSTRGIWSFIEAACDPTMYALSDLMTTSSSHSNDTTTTSAETISRIAIEIGQRCTPQSMHRLMETAVGLGIYQPTVQFFSQLSKPFGDPCDGRAFAVHYPGETVVCDPSVDDFAAIERNAGGVDSVMDISGLDYPASWDHAYPFPVSGSKAALGGASGEDYQSLWVLYGTIGSPSFCSMHSLAIKAGAGNKFRYSVRHAFPGSIPVASSTALQGYGVLLDIKNLEYKNVDDAARPADDADTSAAGNSGDSDGADTYVEPTFIPGDSVKVIAVNVLFIKCYYNY